MSTRFEERLRADLRSAADGIAGDERLERLVVGRVRRRRRRARVAGSGAAAAAVLGMLVAGLALRTSDDGAQTVYASGPPGREGWWPMADAPIEAPFEPAAAWTGREMVVHGDGARAGAAYDPAAGAWRRIADSPLPRGRGRAVWTGSEVVFVVDRSVTDDRPPVAAAYDPDEDSWRSLPDPPLGTASFVVDLAWTGTEVLLLSNRLSPDEPDPGGTPVLRFDPRGGQWSQGATSPFNPRGEARWTGSELLVLVNLGGGGGSLPTPHLTAYDPVADRWREVAFDPTLGGYRELLDWTGTELLLGEVGPDYDLGDVAAYDPVEGTWRALPDAPTPVSGAGVWTGRELLVFEPTVAFEEPRQPARLLALDLATGRWRRGPPTLEVERQGGTRLWTGRELILWGGAEVNTAFVIEEGEAYTPPAR